MRDLGAEGALEPENGGKASSSRVAVGSGGHRVITTLGDTLLRSGQGTEGSRVKSQQPRGGSRA